MRPPTPREQFAKELFSGTADLWPSSSSRSLLDAFHKLARTTAKPEAQVETTPRLPPLTPAQMSDHVFILHRARMIAAKKLRQERERELQGQKRVGGVQKCGSNAW
ncbi:hypothetical protein EDC01DRAFT_782243 [Geopyxis carbonaria]|nr:hypothetical protein EDC01DRAFT_782243 [Geopyxis carbonaria]